MREKKQTLRVDALVQRESLPALQARSLSQRIQETVLRFPPYLLSSAVALYSAIGNEVATDEIRDAALRAGKSVFYPRTGKGGDLALVRIRSADELKPGRYRICEPTGTECLTPDEQSGLVVFVPGLAFDLYGRRLGRGQGGYDRLLAQVADGVLWVGLAYELQIVQELPTDNWDQNVHCIITERRTIDCEEFRPRSDRAC